MYKMIGQMILVSAICFIVSGVVLLSFDNYSNISEAETMEEIKMNNIIKTSNNNFDFLGDLLYVLDGNQFISEYETQNNNLIVNYSAENLDRRRLNPEDFDNYFTRYKMEKVFIINSLSLFRNVPYLEEIQIKISKEDKIFETLLHREDIEAYFGLELSTLKDPCWFEKIFDKYAYSQENREEFFNRFEIITLDSNSTVI